MTTWQDKLEISEVVHQWALWRDSGGRIRAVEDRCPHRLYPLSTGEIRGDDIECGYHGLRFDGTGRCTHIPAQKTIPFATMACE